MDERTVITGEWEGDLNRVCPSTPSVEAFLCVFF